jgi:uncharacterized protein YceK
MHGTLRARLRRLGAGIACGVLLTGCASVRSLTDYQPGDPVLFAGTRLDLAAIRQDKPALARFHARPPAWPWLDLPFSFVADLFVWLIPRTPATPPGAPGSES